MVAIMGPSGSGKSTLMAILGCLDIPSKGSYRLEGQAVEKLTDNQLAQSPEPQGGVRFPAVQPAARVPMPWKMSCCLCFMMECTERRGWRKPKPPWRPSGLADRMQHNPNQLSGGEQQRVAIATMPWSMIRPSCWRTNRPATWIPKPEKRSSACSKSCMKRNGQTVIYVTHDAFIARHTQRIIRLVDGKIISDEPVAHPLVAGTPRPEEALND